jgi:hypothetical protein
MSQPERPGGDPHALRWLGSAAMHLDTPTIKRCDRVVIGCYGGNTGAGANKNEDAAHVWAATDGSWEFAVLVDAHYSSESAAVILAGIAAQRDAIVASLTGPLDEFVPGLHTALLTLFRSKAFRARCQQVVGEASCLICARREHFLWWMNIGDCVLYLFHPELARLGQFALNQRSFFEWIGARNTFDLPIPCYTTGVRELFPGMNRILLTTDGLLECGGQPFTDARALYALFNPGSPTSDQAAVERALATVHHERGRDSATLIAWSTISRNTRW